MRCRAIHKLEVLYDFRSIDSSNELQCIRCFQKELGTWLSMAMREYQLTAKA
jgi:hypothetical protein